MDPWAVFDNSPYKVSTLDKGGHPDCFFLCALHYLQIGPLAKPSLQMGASKYNVHETSIENIFVNGLERWISSAHLPRPARMLSDMSTDQNEAETYLELLKMNRPTVTSVSETNKPRTIDHFLTCISCRNIFDDNTLVHRGKLILPPLDKKLYSTTSFRMPSGADATYQLPSDVFREEILNVTIPRASGKSLPFALKPRADAWPMFTIFVPTVDRAAVGYLNFLHTVDTKRCIVILVTKASQAQCYQQIPGARLSSASRALVTWRDSLIQRARSTSPRGLQQRSRVVLCIFAGLGR